MLIPDMPAAPPQSPPVVLIAQTNQAQGTTNNTERVLGVCEVVANEEKNYPNSIAAAETYFVNYDHLDGFTHEDWLAAKTTILIQSKHGTLVEVVTDPHLSRDYRYTPDKGYVGNDSADVLVEIKGMKVKVHYFIHVLEYGEKDAYDANCTEGSAGHEGQWKISLDPNGNPVLTAIALPVSSTLATTLTSSSLNDWLDSAHLDAFVADASPRRLGFVFKPNVYHDRWVTLR